MSNSTESTSTIVFFFSLTPRLRYLYLAVAGPEEDMAAEGIIVGVIGMSRTRFDSMLRPLPQTPTATDGRSKSTMLVDICIPFIQF